MRFSLIQLRAFQSKWRGTRLTDEDLQALEQLILSHPDAGQVMRGTGGLRKVRFAPRSSHRGKSGAFRVCYAVFPEHGRVYLVTLFAKSEQANLTAAERTDVKAMLERIGAALRRGESP